MPLQGCYHRHFIKWIGRLYRYEYDVAQTTISIGYITENISYNRLL